MSLGRLSISSAKNAESAKARNYKRRPLDEKKVTDDILSIPSRDKVQVFVTTWNMGNAEAEGFENVFNEENYVNRFDIFVIGLQESTYSLKSKGARERPISVASAGAVSGASIAGGASGGTSKESQNCIEHLGALIDDILGPKFYRVRHCYRAQLQLYVFARKTLAPRISNVEQSIENTGFLHVFPNKGGLMVTMQVDGTKLAFVSCHLAAHEGVNFCEERNASIVEILGGVRAGDKRLDITEQFHHIFWMGDMNYRITYDTAVPTNTKKNVKKFTSNVHSVEQALSIRDLTLGVESSKLMSHKAESIMIGFDNFSDSDSDAEDEGEGGGGFGLNEDCEGSVSTGGGSEMRSKKGNSPRSKSQKEVDRLKKMKKTHDLIARENWPELMKYDELNREISAGRVLNDFVALTPAFPPTFKRARHRIISHVHGISKESFHDAPKAYAVYNNDEGDLDKTVSFFYNDKRMPSYTDRILYKSMPTFNGCVKTMFFESCEEASSSDHKPVRAGFEISLSKGEYGIYVDKQLLKWVGAISSTTSAQRSDVHILKLTVSNLRGENLEEMDSQMFGGGSDPYIIITCDPAPTLLYKGTFTHDHDGVKSKVIKHNLNPVWDAPMEVLLASVDLKGLARNGSLIFSVWDEDRLNADDIIGVFTIPLRNVILAFSEGRAYDFNEELRLNSELMGKLSGSITVEGDFKEVACAYLDLESDRLVTERYITLHQACEEHLSRSGCGCILT